MRTWKTWDELLAELEEKEKLARIAGGSEKQKAQKEKGKLLCRERVEALADPGSFVEVNMLVETQTFEFDMQKKKDHGRRCNHWVCHRGWSQGFCLLPGRHSLWGVCGKGSRGTD